MNHGDRYMIHITIDGVTPTAVTMGGKYAAHINVVSDARIVYNAPMQ